MTNKALQEKYPHLEVSVLTLSEVKKDNESFRIDSEYFKKEYLTKKAKLLPISTKLKNLMASGYYGILPKSDDYLDEGLNLIRGKDVRDSSLEISNLVKVPHSYFQERYCVHKNDILFLVKGATIGYSDGVSLIIDEPSEKMIFNGSVFKLQVKNINPFYLYAFMMTHYFTFQKLREVANNGIEYNSLPTIKNFLIPIFPMPFQLEIEKLVKDSHKALESSKALYKEAENLLYESLGLDSKNPLQSILNTHCKYSLCHSKPPLYHCEALAQESPVIARNEMTKQSIYENLDCHEFDKSNSRNDTTPSHCEEAERPKQSKILESTQRDISGLRPQYDKATSPLDSHNALSPNYTIATLKESFLKTGRLDAEYYQSKYEDIETKIHNFPTIKLKDLVQYPITSGATPKAGGSDYTDSKNGIPFLRAVDLKNARVDIANLLYIKPETHEKSLKRTKLMKGDILFSIAGVIGRCAIFDYAFEANINQALAILRFTESKKIKRLYLIAFFNSQFGQMYLERYSRQGLQTNLNLDEVGNLEIPIIDSTIQESIAKHIQKSFELRTEAKSLLEKAKSEVESALNNANNGGG